MTEESSILSATPKPIKQPRMNPQDLRNSDLVSRLLAATPPYLYSPPVGPPNFFFSEMLRSLVQNKTNEQATKQLAQQMRKPRKRSWGQQNRFVLDGSQSTPGSSKDDHPEIVDKVNDKPLELTNKIPIYHAPAKLFKPAPPEILNRERDKDNRSIQQTVKMSKTTTSTTQSGPTEPSAASLPPADLVLPPPPPIWYPPLYPPYGIDPLHFFIDLRVSGHITDRKKENVSPKQCENNNTVLPNNMQIGKHRHRSAFSVPPRREKSPLALNLTSDPASDYLNNNNNNTLMNEALLKHSIQDCSLTKNTNYVLQNLPRIYTTLTSKTEDRHSNASDDVDNRSESDIIETDVQNDDNSRHCDNDTSDDVVIVDQDPDIN